MLIDCANSGRENTALTTSASSTKLEETVSSVMGHKFLKTLTTMELSFQELLQTSRNDSVIGTKEDDNEDKGQSEEQDKGDIVHNWGIYGLISKSPQQQSSQKQRIVNYYSINGRVVSLPKLTQLFRKIWIGFGGRKKPSCILALTLPNDSFDINLSPDKQQVLLTQEEAICQLVEGYVTQLWSGQTNGIFQKQEPTIQAKLTTQPLQRDVDELLEEEDGERTVHKRRFAFVHDLSKAKMQHDSAEREKTTKLQEAGEKKQGQVEPRPKKQKLESRTTMTNDTSKTRGKEVMTIDEERLQQKHEGISKRVLVIETSSNHDDDCKERVESIETGGQKGSAQIESTSSPGIDNIESEAVIREVRQRKRGEEILKTAQKEDTPSSSNDTFETSRRIRPQQTNEEASKPAADSEDSEGAINHEAGRSTSDMERLKWLEIQSKFNRVSRHVPVTPDDCPPHPTMSSKSQNSHLAEIPVLSRKSVQQSKPKNTNATSNLMSLQHFAFQPANSSSRQTRLDSANRIEASRSSPRRSEGDGVRKAFRRDGREGDSSESSTQSKALHPREDHPAIPRKSSEGVPSSSSDGDESRPSNDESENTLSSPSNKPVTWKSFQGTEHICQSARIERLRMYERKRKQKEMRNSRNAEAVCLDNQDVAETVGSQTTKNSVVSLTKSDFGSMHVIGQFNLGFILARCKNNHLWILDQHACDEKYNFERLCRDTKLHEQRLLKPLLMDNLTPSEESCILDHMDVFEANGFRFDFKPEAPIRRRLFLTALPHSGAQDGRKAVQFGKDDVSALCSILSGGSSYDAPDGGTGTDGSGMYGNNAVRRYASTTSTQDSVDRIVARLPKAIAMFASRACRTSIMIGTALSNKEMEKVVQRLSGLDHPWNCPHGRPTMRHVGDVLPVLSSDERRAADHITGPTATVTPMTQQEPTL